MTDPVNEKVTLPWDHPDVRTCGHCGHKRDVHGAYLGANHGYRCNVRGACACPGFQSVDALRAAMDRGEGMP